MYSTTYDIYPGTRPYLQVQQKRKQLLLEYFRAIFPAMSILLAFLVLPGTSADAQQSADYSVNANIIYHFTKYIDWPENKKTGDFIIGIVGDSPLYDELKKNIAGKFVSKQRIIIRQILSPDDYPKCHILFISDNKSNSIKKIVAATAATSTLLVTETEGLAQKGASINFAIVAEHLRLEINKKNIEQQGLNIASELLQLGKIVK